MGNSLRCFIACILPCGALDVVRVLHADGRVEEYSGRITAREVMKANPRHVLSQPLSAAAIKQQSFLHPDAELHKGKIYLLLPTYNIRRESKPKQIKHVEVASDKHCPIESSSTDQLMKQEDEIQCERSKRRSGQRRSLSGRRGRNSWRPVLNSILEGEDL